MEKAKRIGEGKRKEMRLGKALAIAGVASRRASEEMVFEGRVTVNGTLVTAPQTLVDPLQDVISVDGKVLPRAKPDKYYLMLHKPKGYICSSKTESGEKLVVDLFQGFKEQLVAKNPDAVPPRLFTVGRLDVQTTGLLLVTNDGDWAQRVIHPSAGITKEYLVTAEEPVTKRQLADIAAGCEMDGVQVTPVAVWRVEGDPNSKRKIGVEVAEGRNHEVRNLMAHAGVQVKALKRTRVGTIRMPRELMPGMFTELSPVEVKRFLVGPKPKPRKPESRAQEESGDLDEPEE